MIFKNYSDGVKVPVSISKVPLPYLSDRDLAKFASSVSSSVNLVFKNFSCSSTFN